jgi:hypothetical protein
MPKQNRVTPFGALIATPERGTFMGNRGVLHNEAGRIERAWQVKRWLLYLLEFRERKRAVMTPNRYTDCSSSMKPPAWQRATVLALSAAANASWPFKKPGRPGSGEAPHRQQLL